MMRDRGSLFFVPPEARPRNGEEISARVFWNGILPAVRHASEVRIRPAGADQVRTGDLIAYRANGYVRLGRMGAECKDENLVGKVTRMEPGVFLASHWKFLKRWAGKSNWEVEVRPARAEEYKAVVRLWNLCFPDRPMDLDHFEMKICGSPWFSPGGFQIAAKGEQVVGFILASDRRQGGEQVFPGTGFIECVGVHPSERQKGIGSKLLKQARAWLRSRGCRGIRTGHLPVPCDERGWIRGESGVDFFTSNGFEVIDYEQEIAWASSSWDGSIPRRLEEETLRKGIEVRFARQTDVASLEEAVRGWGRRWHHPRSSSELAFYLLAVRGKKILGYCRVVSQEEAGSYDQLDWIWDASVVNGRGSVGFLYVDPSDRGLNLGAALIAKGIDALFRRGCRQVGAFTDLPAHQFRYRRWKARAVGGVATLALPPV